jgi:bifunctional DNA-binding transcriptional regulator/antitoxin component of YhaV-PrlF toxin-antitoxin module
MLFSKGNLNCYREEIMSLIKVRPNSQVTLPSSLRERAKLSVGDLLELPSKKTPRRLVIAEAFLN